MEFTIGGVAYKARKMDTFTQLDIVALLVESGGQSITPILKMTPENRRFVITTCLSLVDREIAPNKWAPIWVHGASRAATEEINDSALLQLEIANQVIGGTLANFFSVSP